MSKGKIVKPKKGKTNAPFTLWISSSEVNTDKFLKSIQAFYQFLQELTKEVVGPDKKVVWKNSVSKGSTQISFHSHLLSPVDKRHLYAVADDIFTAIENDAPPPEELTPLVAKHLHSFVEVTKSTGNTEGLVMSLVRPTKEYEITPELLDPLNKAMNIVEFYGFIEGELQGISSRKGMRVTIYERIQGRSINCFIKQERAALFSQAMKLFNTRIQAYGMVRCKDDGTPLSIDLESIQPLPTDSQIKDLTQLRGIFKDYE